MPDFDKVFGRPSRTVVVGFPLCTPDELGHDDHMDGPVAFMEERFLPRLLVKLGVAPSVSEVRRVAKQRRGPDVSEEHCPIWHEMVAPEIIHLKWGKHLLFIVVGFATEGERNSRLQDLAS